MKKNFDAQTGISIPIALLKPNTKTSIPVVVDASAGTTPNWKLRISWMEVPAKDIPSCAGKESRDDLLVVWEVIIIAC